MKKLFGLMMFVLLGSLSALAQSASGVIYLSVAWSPDSQNLSFTRMEVIDMKARKMSAEIYTMKADGTKMTKVTGEGRNKFGGVWTTDGKRILYSAIDDPTKTSDLFSIDIKGDRAADVTKSCGYCSAPSISPDGKWIAFNKEIVSHKPQIAVMKADGSGVRQLTNDDTLAFYDPVWSPNGKKIVYYVERGDKKDQIWSMNADGSEKTLLTNNIGHNFFPSWSADGKRIIFCSVRDGEEQVIYSMKSDGSDLKRLLTPSSSYARISPNGKKIAYITGRFPSTTIYVANADGSDPLKVTP